MIGHARPLEESFLTQLHEESASRPISLGFFLGNRKVEAATTHQLFNGWELRK